MPSNWSRLGYLMPAKGRNANTLYHGVAGDGPGPRTVRVNGRILEPRSSLMVRRHSPDGFSWGYHGSGASQLALALLLDYTGSRDAALALYPAFRDMVVAAWPKHAEWWLTGEQVERAIAIVQADPDGASPAYYHFRDEIRAGARLDGTEVTA